MIYPKTLEVKVDSKKVRELIGKGWKSKPAPGLKNKSKKKDQESSRFDPRPYLKPWS